MKKHLLLAGLLLLPTAVYAEELGAIFKRVTELSNSGNYSKALEELEWAKKELEKGHAKKVQSFFPDTLGSFKGAKFESNAALGLLSVERDYEGSDGSVKASLSGGTGGMAGAGLGNMAQLGKMAAMMQTESNQETTRIAGKTALVEKGEDGSSSSVTVFLDSGSVLKLESESTDAEGLKKLVEGFKLAELDSYLKGS